MNSNSTKLPKLNANGTTYSSNFQSNLPSLSVNIKIVPLKELEFANSLPVFRRELYNVFDPKGLEPIVTKKDFRPKPDDEKTSNSQSNKNRSTQKFSDQRSKDQKMASPDAATILSSKSVDELIKEMSDKKNANRESNSGSRGKNTKNFSDYAMKIAKRDPLMLSDVERKEKFDTHLTIVAQKKKDEELKNRTRRNAVSKQNVDVNQFEKINNGDDEMMNIKIKTASNEVLTEDEIAVYHARALEIEREELTKTWDKYQFYSPIARDQFRQGFKNIQQNLYNHRGDESLLTLTPRSKYLMEVEKNKLLPLALILRKNSNPLGICLAHHGLGDNRILPLIEVLDQLPALQTIVLADNRLTDKSLMPFAVKLRSMKVLTHLDLSFNKMDDSSETIMDYLRSRECSLKELLLNGADVDDNECVNLAMAIAENKSIKTLCLTNNLIGKTELNSVLSPNEITGGMALGTMLEKNITLTKLDLSWNSIRGSSAVAFAKSLHVNKTLKRLFLAYNSFGDMPSQILGSTLKSHKSLIELDLECNSITPKAATVLANSISFNETLLTLNINGNSLGKIGAQALVAAIQRSSTDTRKLQVSFINCDCRMENEDIFSAANPQGVWKLNLSEPYGQMVAAECIYLANHRAGCRIDRVLYNNEPVYLERSYGSNDVEAEKKKFKYKEFLKNCAVAAENLIKGDLSEASRYLQILLDQFDFYMDDEQRINVLKKTLDLWNIKAKREKREDLQEVFLYEVFFSLFMINDTDMSGTMELDEFIETLELLGRHNFDRDVARRLLAEYDRDESGSVDANEFGTIMLHEFCKTEMPKGDLVDAATGLPWVIPQDGYCVIALSSQSELPSLYNIGQDYGIDNIIQSIIDAKTDEQRDILFENTTSSPYFFLSFEQGQNLLEVMTGLNRIPLDVMASILPQIVNEEQTCKFLDNNLSTKGKLALRVKIGQLYNAFIGLYTGHYAIDMKQPSQANGGRRLGAVCITESKFNRELGVNTSQKGNFTNFRNEKLGVHPVDVTGRWFAVNANTAGKILHFDYVSTQKPRKGYQCITDKNFDKIINDLNLQELRVVWDRIQYKLRLFEEQFSDSTGVFSEELFTIHQLEQAEILKAEKKDKTKRRVVQTPGEHGHHHDHFHVSTIAQVNQFFTMQPHDFPELYIELPITPQYLISHYMEYLDTCHHYHDIYPEERMRDFSRPNFNPNERPPTPDDMKKGPAPNKALMHPIVGLGIQRLLQLQILLPGLHFSIAQLKEMIQYFPPDEGYLRIQLIQSVFSHLTDMENIYQIIDEVLTVDERQELFHRIGVMNLFDPMKPDRLYRLDLRRYDHREWVKILVLLGVNEPGENWEMVEYRWGKYDDPVPGWTLPGTWTSPDDGGNSGGPRNHGWLRVQYRSHGNGCQPVISVRKYARKRVLAGIKRVI